MGKGGGADHIFPKIGHYQGWDSWRAVQGQNYDKLGQDITVDPTHSCKK